MKQRKGLMVCQCGGRCFRKVEGRRDGSMQANNERALRYTTTAHECQDCGARLHTARAYAVPAPAQPAQLPTNAYRLTAHNDFDVYFYGVYLTTQEAYLWCEKATEDWRWYVDEAIRAASYDAAEITTPAWTLGKRQQFVMEAA